MKKTMLWLVVLAALCIGAVGCQKSTDPVTGETRYAVDPNVAMKVEGGVEAAIGLMAILSAFWPVLLPIATLGVGVLGAWRKMKPQLVAEQGRAELYYNTTGGIVQAIEEFKKLDPKNWVALEARLVKAIGPEADAVIRALRGLPPKT